MGTYFAYSVQSTTEHWGSRNKSLTESPRKHAVSELAPRIQRRLRNSEWNRTVVIAKRSVPFRLRLIRSHLFRGVTWRATPHISFSSIPICAPALCEEGSRMWRQHYSGLILLTVYAYVALLSVLCSSGKWYIICLDNLGGLGTAIYSLFVFRKVSTCWERGR